MGDEVCGRSRQEGGDGAVNAGADHEVLVPQVVDPGPGFDVKSNPVLGEQLVPDVQRNVRWGSADGRAAVEEESERCQVLGEVGETRVAAGVRFHERSHLVEVRREGQADGRVRGERRNPLLDLEVRTPQEHRRAPDDVDVPEPEVVEVALRELAAYADPAGAVEDRPDELAGGVVHRF